MRRINLGNLATLALFGVATVDCAATETHRIEVGSADFTAELEVLGSPWPAHAVRTGATTMEVRTDSSRLPAGHYAALLRLTYWNNGQSYSRVVPVRSRPAEQLVRRAVLVGETLTLSGAFPVDGVHVAVGELPLRLAGVEVRLDGDPLGLALVSGDQVVATLPQGKADASGQISAVAYRGDNDTMLSDPVPIVAGEVFADAPLPEATSEHGATHGISIVTTPEAFIPLRYQKSPAIGGDPPVLLTRESSSVSGNGWNLALDGDSDYLFHSLPSALGRVDSRYALRSVLRAGLGGVPQPAPEFESRTGGFVFRPTSEASYQFLFESDHLLTLTSQGTSTSLYLPEGVSVALTGTCPQGQNFSRFDMETLTAPARTYAAGTPLSSNPATFRHEKPARISLACAAPVTGPVRLTLAVDPPRIGLQARIGTSGPFVGAPVSQTVTSGQQSTIAVNDPQVVDGTGYRFVSWSNGAQTATTTVTPTSEQSYTARFQLACYELNISVNPPASGGTITRNPAAGVAGFPSNNCYAPGTQVTMTAVATPTAPFVNWTGITATGPTATVTMNNPVNATANFQGNVTLTVQTNPSGLQAAIGGAADTAPVSRQVPLGQPQTASVAANQMNGGTGYLFTNWSTGATSSSTTVTPTANTTVTANFQAACHVVTINVSPSSSGSVSRSGTSAPGFQSDCYMAGSRLTMNASANSGFVFYNWSGGGSSDGSFNSVVVTGPLTITANFVAVPVLDFSYVSRSGSGIVTVGMQVRNTGGSTANLVRVTAVGSPPNGAYAGATPPFTVAASLAAGSSAGFSLTFRTGAGPFSFSITGTASNAATVSETISVP